MGVATWGKLRVASETSSSKTKDAVLKPSVRSSTIKQPSNKAVPCDALQYTKLYLLCHGVSSALLHHGGCS